MLFGSLIFDIILGNDERSYTITFAQTVGNVGIVFGLIFGAGHAAPVIILYIFAWVDLQYGTMIVISFALPFAAERNRLPYPPCRLQFGTKKVDFYHFWIS